MKEELERVTEIFDGGVNSVTAFEKETDEPGADAAAAAGDANHLSFFGHFFSIGIRCCVFVGAGAFAKASDMPCPDSRPTSYTRLII